MSNFNYKKATQALANFADLSGGTINKMAAIKLVWLADRLHLRKYGRTITGDQYVAMKFGPVASTVKDILDKNRFTEYSGEFLSAVVNNDFKILAKPILKVFSQTDRDVMKEVFIAYGKNDRFDLSIISHHFPEWKKFENELTGPGPKGSYPIDIHDFFINVEDDTRLFIENSEALNVAKDLFDEHSKFEELFSK